MTDKIKKELTVKWIVVNKKIVKFVEEDSKTYKLGDNVLEYLDEIKANVPVNVTIVDDKVIFIQKREGEIVEERQPEQEEANDEPQEKTADEMVYTVKAISKTRDYYLFDEAGEKEWFTVALNVKDSLKDVKRGDVLKVNVVVTNDGKRDTRTITYAQVQSSSKEEPKQETKRENTTTKKSSYRDEESTDKRTALMTAKDIVVAYINSKAELVNSESKTSELLKRISKVCYEAIQSL